MNLATTSNALAIAAAAALAFAVLLLAGRLVRRLPGRPLPFTGSVINEPSQHVRDRWQELGQHRNLVLLPFMVLLIVAAAVRAISPADNGPALSGWQQLALLAFVGLAAAFAVYRLWAISRERRRLRLRRDAGLVVGHALQRLSANRNRTFHDVPSSAGILDHVIVGLHGVYAVHVIARTPARQGIARLHGDTLSFSKHGEQISIANVRKVAARLARECAKVLHHEVQVRLVIAVPGWEIRAQTSDDVLLANERNLMMLTGWKDQRDYLLNEDVDKLHALFDRRCARRSV